MSIFKCKMCGGDLETAEGVTIAECEYCGTKQTVPKAMDENLQNLFNRANTLRIKSEFDKAEKLYEKIIQADTTQSEAYWGLILCKYGIEYVDDPATFKKIPTCHRASYDSIIADDDYKSAIENADLSQRAIYEEQAKEIDRIQKDILALAQKEETYDVFICYKETDADGHRTQDSVIANDIYYQLTQEGFKVFYAAITLEGKLGSAYEPIIFAALNSAKVMLSIGTKPEHFNAVWVKNEWSRFLKIIQKDRSKLLIPCYRDMDAYELPEEFAHLQAQDMAKIGFINDLVRGIKKVVEKDEPKQTTVVKETVVSSTNANVAPLLKRAFMFLEDGDWQNADEYCEKVLDLDPECAEAYLGKLMVELMVNKKEDLEKFSTPFNDRNSYQKAIRFADDELKTMLINCIQHINLRNETERLERIYSKAVAAMRAAKTEHDFRMIADSFESISEYKDSAALATRCNEYAEATRKDAIYSRATCFVKNGRISWNEKVPTIKDLKNAINLLELIKDWKDSEELILLYQRTIEEMAAKQEAERLEAERREQIERREAEIRAKRTKRYIAIFTPILCAVIVFIIVLNSVIIPYTKYNSVLNLIGDGKYAEAQEAFNAIDEYKKNEKKRSKFENAVLKAKYEDAVALMDAKEYIEAISAFKSLNGYKDSTVKIQECELAIFERKYNDATALVELGDLDNAYVIFNELGTYKDSFEKANKITLEKLKSAKVGDHVVFGSYEQDNILSNGKEDIEWLVLEVNEGKLFVISKYALDCIAYNINYAKVTWNTCTLHQWLNDEFFYSAFDEVKQSMISTANVSADKNPEYSTNPGTATKDKVFILSLTEAKKYFSSSSECACQPTKHALANGAKVNQSNGNCTWWLRTPGSNKNFASCVNDFGFVYERGFDVNRGDYTIRPVMWIDTTIEITSEFSNENSTETTNQMTNKTDVGGSTGYAAYDEKINEYLDANSLSLDEFENRYKKNYDYDCSSINAFILGYYRPEEGKEISYALHDVDRNGIPELFFSEMEIIIDVYTLHNDKIVKLFENCWFGDRSRVHALSNGQLYCEGSSGAAASSCEFYEFKNDGSGLDLIGAYYCDGFSGEDKSLDATYMLEEEYYAFVKPYNEMIFEDFDWIPVSEN